MAINRVINFKRNQNSFANAQVAREALNGQASSLENGEIILATYFDTKSNNGTVANILGIKAQGQLFFIDIQTLLNTLGINYDGTIDPNNPNSVINMIDTLSGKSITDVEDTATIDFTKEIAVDGTQKVKADVKLSEESGNIILTKEDGIYTNVDYDALTNSIIINGVSKALNSGSIIDSLEYDSATEMLIITYHTTATAEAQTVEVSLKDLIEEYSFDDITDADHNVKFTVTRNVSGATTVQADVSSIDCGEY